MKDLTQWREQRCLPRPEQVALATQVDLDLKTEFEQLADYLGVSCHAALEEAAREWMIRYAVIHHYPGYGFAPEQPTPDEVDRELDACVLAQVAHA